MTQIYICWIYKKSYKLLIYITLWEIGIDFPYTLLSNTTTLTGDINMNALDLIAHKLIVEKPSMESLRMALLEICEELESRSAPSNEGPKTRNYGPASQRKAERRDAWDILYGDHKGKKVNQIAVETGLSRGQIYSIRGGYTFRDVKAEEF